MKSFLLLLIGALLGAACLWYLVLGRPPTPAPPPAATQSTAPLPPAEQAVVTTPLAPAASVGIALPATLSPPAAAASVPDIALPPIDRMPPATAPDLAAPSAPALVPPSSQLVIPVAGIKAQALSDTFTDARSGGRVHDAIDIMAPRGTPVLATDDGKVEKLFTSKQGGLTLYQFDPTGGYVYYYAHLDSYAAGITEGKPLHRGDVIGYVGSTGNASPDGPHLHFAILVLGLDKRWWQGTAINPYPLLVGRPR